MTIEFYNPPDPILFSHGTKEGVELGGNKSIVSIDVNHNFYNEGNIFTELSWAEFYKDIEGLENQIDTFTMTKYETVRDDAEALIDTISKNIYNIIKDHRLFYGIADFEVDAFMNKNCVIPGLKLDIEIINKLLEAHKKTRDKDLFPDIIIDKGGIKKILIEFQGKGKKYLQFYGSKLEDLSENLRMAKGFATGIVCTSQGAANLYVMNSNIVLKDDIPSKLYIDRDNIKVIEMGIQREILFPISWFRIDLGIKSFETLKLWDEIKNDIELKKALDHYERYILELIYKKYKNVASIESIGIDLSNNFDQMTSKERKKALRDMEDAIKILTSMLDE